MFSITPSQGKLTPTERPAQLQVTFKASREIQIKEQPILSCQIIEPNVAANGETIACIPVEVSARSVYTKYVKLTDNCIFSNNEFKYKYKLLFS